MVKCTITLWLFFFLCSVCPAQDLNKFEISGNLKGLRDDLAIYLLNLRNGRYDTVLATKSKNQKFEFKGSLDRMGEFHFIKLDTLKRNFPLILDNSALKISGVYARWPEANIEGSRSTTDFISFSRKKRDFQSNLEALKVELLSLDIKKDSLLVDNINQRSLALRDSINCLWKNFVYTNPSSLYTPFLILAKSNWNYDEKNRAFDHLTIESKESYYGMQLKDQLEILRQSTSLDIGSKAPDFISETTNGARLSLYEVVSRSRLTLLDFWASWCGPCRQQMPHLKELYDLFRTKGFDILSVSLDQNEKNWKRAIDADDMIWNNVSQLKYFEETAAKIYRIQGVPSTFLLDSDGRIIGKNMSMDQLKNRILKELE